MLIWTSGCSVALCDGDRFVKSQFYFSENKIDAYEPGLFLTICCSKLEVCVVWLRPHGLQYNQILNGENDWGHKSE